MSILKEFKEFAMKGNLVDMAIAFVMGGAFGKVVSSFIDGIVMPVVGKLTAGVDFNTLKYVLSEAKIGSVGAIISSEASIKYGSFLTVVLDFIVVAFVMFFVIKAINKSKKKEAQAPVPVPVPVVVLTKEEILLTEIRDVLKQR